MPGYTQVAVPPAPTTEFTDNFTKGSGIVLVDLAHRNRFFREELSPLFLPLVSRGLTVRFLSPADNLEKELLGDTEEEKGNGETPANGEEEVALNDGNEEEKEAPADVFIIIAPQEEFSNDALKTVKKFVDKGGKLLLIADPTRSGTQINKLAMGFGLIFESDYLYNMIENELNYRNVFITDFKQNGVTGKLKKIALYTAGSISSADAGIAFTGGNTFSSLVESRQRLSPIALTSDDKILAVYDITFMTEPYNGILDNNQLIANIADWVAQKGKRTTSK
ncbi:MAG: hypothetical protein HYX84_02875 [Chloroflexi bacterium]|nr:hypothetical protein [Chloroflexota bacterium]